MVTAGTIPRRLILCLVPSAMLGACDRFLRVARPAKAGPQYDAVRKFLEGMPEDLSERCVNWLGANAYIDIGSQIRRHGRDAVKWFIRDLLEHDLLAVGVFDDPAAAAITGTSCTDLPVDYASLCVNVQGAFFSSDWTVGADKIVGGTTAAKREILIHELAHGLGAPEFRQDDYRNSNAQRVNAELVKKFAFEDLSRR